MLGSLHLLGSRRLFRDSLNVCYVTKVIDNIQLAYQSNSRMMALEAQLGIKWDCTALNKIDHVWAQLSSTTEVSEMPLSDHQIGNCPATKQGSITVPKS